jgi:two-component system, NtrC family, response regulator AtoC
MNSAKSAAESISRPDGFIGGSTLDKLPLQAAVRATTAGFKSLCASVRAIAPTRSSQVDRWPWGVIGRAPAIRRVIHHIQRVAPTRLPVLILGENGTGKVLVARALHAGSSRNRRDMIILNCAAIPRDLLESELFGYEPGAFTGATRRRIGKFEDAHGSTLFLDEIGDLEIERKRPNSWGFPEKHYTIKCCVTVCYRPASEERTFSSCAQRTAKTNRAMPPIT